MPFWSFSKHARKTEKKAKAEKKQDLRPVLIDGGVIERTWWSKAWNKNLESYADYADRIGRGRSSVVSGAILDLQVGTGEIKALVQGARAKPYSIKIRIRTLNKNNWNLVTSACKGKLESLEELLSGKFPRALEESLMQRKTGLFPSPGEIAFECSCPDWASMCKHIAATLYGVGARLEEDPALIFTLRGVDMLDLIKRTGSSNAKELLQKTPQKSSRTIDRADRSAAFGVEPKEDAGSARSNRAIELQLPGEESVRMADVRKVLKQQLRMDIKFAKKEKPSKNTSVKKIGVKGKANEIVEKVVNKQFRPGKRK